MKNPLFKTLFVIAFLVQSVSAVQESSKKESVPRRSDQWSEPSEAERLYALEVHPLFQKKCVACHGAGDSEIEGEFDIRTRAGLLAGGATYGSDVVLPGNAAESQLLPILSRDEKGFEMPPKESEKLTPEEVATVRKWIEGGAPVPSKKRIAEIYDRYAEGIQWKAKAGLSDEWTQRKYKRENLWAYQPLQKFELDAQVKNGVDHFIDARLKQNKIRPAEPAKRENWIRRATFDLTGLPPTPAEVDRFVSDPRSDDQAYATVVDRLLASPQYGVQQARHWLDVVRYADSAGFANDWERPNAWRYRDYVVRSFNADKPYDQFVLEQVAGDLIANELPDSDPLSNSRAAELLVATGFLRMGPWEQTGMSVARVTRQQFLDDVTDAVGQVFLAHPLQCCRCHDHKFDPIPTEDYYSIQAVFANTQFADAHTTWIPAENRSGFESVKKYQSVRKQQVQQMIDEIYARQRDSEKEWFDQRGLSYKNRTEAKKAGVKESDLPPFKVGWTPNDFGRERIGRKWNARFSWEAERFRPVAFSVYEGKTILRASVAGPIRRPANPAGKGTWSVSRILTGGDLDSAGKPVVPGVLSAAEANRSKVTVIDKKNRRLDFARWMVEPSHPLTARVIVNRIWQTHFGKGLAGNPNNFGATGKKPTHPRLLDYLANKMIAEKWSLKKMHRLIMLSQTYRRSSRHPDIALIHEEDPGEESYAVFPTRRLAAEELRDAMLAVSGELNPELGGIPARPDMNLEAALQPRMIMGTFAPAYVPHPDPKQRNRRTLFTIRLRGLRDPFLETFNQPGPDKSCELRDRALVAPQALTLINGPEIHDRSLALANRVLSTTESDSDAVKRLFRLSLGRHPDAVELSQTLEFWAKMSQREKRIEPTRFAPPKTVVRTAVEENTGETFTFTERLVEYEDYQPDLQPADVDIRTRSLGRICLAILNSNEFVYLD